MDIKLELDNDVIILKLTGNLDASCVEELKAQVARLIEKNYLHVLLDMSRVDYIDSTGLGACSHISRDLAAKGGLLACVGLNDHVHRIFHLTRFDQRVKIFYSRNDAVNALLTSVTGKKG